MSVLLWVAFCAGAVSLALPSDDLLRRSILLTIQVGVLLYALFRDD